MAGQYTALVVGASGIIGNAVVRELKGRPDWQVRALPRTFVDGVETIKVDLLDAQATARALEAARDTTHVFYAALKGGADLLDEERINGGMLRNLLDGLKAVGAPLQRVVHYQGAKVYGVHLGPTRAPFYEDDPRHMTPNFYYVQEDLLRERGAAGDFEWSILRPDVVVGDIAGNPMNIVMVMGVFAALSKAVGVPLRFPGSEKVYSGVLAQTTDADWMARASVWAALDPMAAGEAFNLVNEPFRWERVWKHVAAAFDMEVGAPQPFSLAKQMPLKADAWQRLVQRHGLQSLPYEKLVGWWFGDFVFNTEFDMVSDMGKIRRAGFTEAVQTEATMVTAIERLRSARQLP
ncbi:SDR family oxidoreductase [Massilia sp. YIM B02443]|uniref:SDR family oxidoreductase n=1 Tax=Massilia sp. YIM B02443 TaxID=3050127 RepID=UPI0025B7131F|nr:SDR family oxidoreductase [Massilia sp. YIM B02443]MDN4036115.1 SDR family oxidoreductase [Massilia sp. YIM B02443]